MISREDQVALADQNPELKEILKSYKEGPSLTSSADIHTLRAELAEAKRKLTASTSTSYTPADYIEVDKQIPMRDGESIAIRIHKPKNPARDGCPGLVMLHGGGWALGGLDNEVALCRKWTTIGGIAINVDYRLAPEHTFPVPVEDAFDALVWTANHVKDLGINPKKGFIIGGVSAGANITCAITHLYRDGKMEPRLTGQYLSVVTVCDPAALPEKYKDFVFSREQNQNAVILDRKGMSMFEGSSSYSQESFLQHIGSDECEGIYKANPYSPLRSPLLFLSHKDLPPTYFQVCGADPLRDEGLLYEKILREEYGIQTKMDLFPGLPHSFWSFFPNAEFSKSFQKDTTRGLEWLLEQSSST
ncbi:Alpha/Beta hydrolase protein [Tricladium varicosporioides]|nr:Alpha/Beta hydrolase protein [Hymenoscyphus varicosporioides]